MNFGLSLSPRTRAIGSISCAGAILLVWFSKTALPADWSLEAGLSEKIDYDTNINLDIDPPGYALGSISTLDANLFALTPRSRLELLSTLAYQAYTGPGATPELDGFLPDLEAWYKTKTHDTDFDFGASYDVQNLTSATIDDTGFLQETGVNRHRFRVQGGLEYDIDDIDKAAFRTIASKVDFTPSTDDVVPYEDLDNTLTFSRALSPTMDGKLILGLEFYQADNDQNTFNTIYSAEANFISQLTRRLKIRGGIGANAVDAKLDRVEVSDSTGGFSIGPIFEAGLEYRTLRSTFSLDVSEKFSPTDFGDVDEIQQLKFRATHNVNDATMLDFSLVYTHQIPASDQPAQNAADPTTAFSLSPRLTYQLTREWQMQLGYRLLTEQLSEGDATSNEFYMLISRDIVILP